mgnify:FL=1
MMETFKWCVRPNYSVDNEPNISEVVFGDGYTQRRLNGLNALLKTYSVVIKVRNKSAPDVLSFFERHQGIKPFYFIDPLTKQLKKVICKKWPAKVDQSYTEITCDFKEDP